MSHLHANMEIYTHRHNSWKQTAQKVWAACMPQGEGRWKLKPYAKRERARERERDECKEKRDGEMEREEMRAAIIQQNVPAAFLPNPNQRKYVIGSGPTAWMCVWDHMVLYMYKPFKSVRMSISMCTMDVVWMCTAKRAVSVLDPNRLQISQQPCLYALYKPPRTTSV